MLSRTRSPLAFLYLLAVLAACSANEPFDPDTWANSRPVASVWVLRADPDSLAPTTYNNATFYWSAVDVDGFVAGYHISIDAEGGGPRDWIFTTEEESTATYATDQEGRAAPTLYVVAEDDRGALSDTVTVTFPLFNFPPFIEFAEDFKPVRECFGVASFEYFGFDIDGDETLLPYVEYRYEGADPDLVFEIGDPLADPSSGWVRVEKDPRRFSLALRSIPAGDPTKNFEQTLYVRAIDEAGGTGEHSYSWTVYEVVGEVLLIDDALNNPSLASRDSFYRNSMAQLMPSAHSVWDITEGLPDRDADIWATIAQFRVILWYTGGDPSVLNLKRVTPLLTNFVNGDLDPDSPGVQSGRLFLETQYITTPSTLSPAFVTNVLGVSKTPEPRSSFRVSAADLNGAVLRGSLEVEPQIPEMPLISHAGQNYLGNPGFFFQLYGLTALSGTAELYRFEAFTYTNPRIPESPLMAVRSPDTGLARSVTFAFQFEFCNALGNATEALGVILRDHFGQTVSLPSEAGP